MANKKDLKPIDRALDLAKSWREFDTWREEARQEMKASGVYPKETPSDLYSKVSPETKKAYPGSYSKVSLDSKKTPGLYFLKGESK